MKCIYVCPNCLSFYGSEVTKREEKCPECHAILEKTDIQYDTFVCLSKEDRELLKKQYVETKYEGIDYEKQLEEAKKNKRFTPLPESGWVTFLCLFNWLVLIVVCIVGLVCLFEEQFSIGIGCILGGLVYCGMIFVVCGIASDARHIRNQIDRYYFERDKETD